MGRIEQRAPELGVEVVVVQDELGGPSAAREEVVLTDDVVFGPAPGVVDPPAPAVPEPPARLQHDGVIASPPRAHLVGEHVAELRVGARSCPRAMVGCVPNTPKAGFPKKGLATSC